MAFTEKTHAFLSGKYYEYLTAAFGERGKAAFIHATQYYASQRGRRMAQRAIRDGAPLNQVSYNYYSEWAPTSEVEALGQGSRAEPTANGKLKITQCPWYAQFQEMGAREAGRVYCTYLDEAISQGFNPALGYIVDQTLHTADCCIHRLKTGDINEGSGRGKNPAGVKSFEYHCAHLYWSFREVAMAIFGKAGEEAADKVLTAFEETYGKEMAQALLTYRDANFNVCG